MAISSICYPAGIFPKTKHTLSFQSKDITLIICEKIIAFQRILVLWGEHFEKLYLEMLALLLDFVAEIVSFKNTAFLKNHYLHRL